MRLFFCLYYDDGQEKSKTPQEKKNLFFFKMLLKFIAN